MEKLGGELAIGVYLGTVDGQCYSLLSRQSRRVNCVEEAVCTSSRVCLTWENAGLLCINSERLCDWRAMEVDKKESDAPKRFEVKKVLPGDTQFSRMSWTG